MKWKNVLMFVLNMSFLLSAAFAFLSLCSLKQDSEVPLYFSASFQAEAGCSQLR